jgi:signal transduction histidine kinase/ligand-binding sensor domain-containing protein/FixJ family two-component response regulator
LATLAAAPGLALDPDTPPQRYGHTLWRLEQGLPHESVESILQTRDGYLWIGTQGGLARFDGVRFTLFRAGEAPGLANDAIAPMLEDPDGTLWIGTDGGGLLRFRGGRFAREAGPGDRLRALVRGSDGTLWAATYGQGLARLSGGRWSVLTTRDGLPSDNVQSVFCDRDGTLWIGTVESGLARLRQGRWTTWTVRDGLPADRVNAILRDRAGTLWVGTSGGLALLSEGMREGGERAFATRPGFPEGSVKKLLEDRDGNLWVGTTHGLARLGRSGTATLTIADGLSDDSIRSLAQDREGNLWVGTYGGLDRLRDDKLLMITARDGLPSENTWAILEDHAGALWVGTIRGLCRLRDGVATTFGRKQGLSDEAVRAIAEDRAGTLWIGTLEGGLNRFRDGRFRSFLVRDGLPSNSVFAVLPDRRGRVWVGTYQGLALLEGDRITAVLDRRAGLPHENVWALHEDAAGDIWVGTRGGVVRLHDGRPVPFEGERELAGLWVWCFVEDADGSLWIGTGEGLRHLSHGRVSRFGRRDGLLDDSAYQILDDGRGDLWMASGRGVFRVHKADLEAFAHGRIGWIPSVVYGTADGMKSPVINGGSSPAGWRGRDGRLWFPTLRGVAVTDPRRPTFNALPPPVWVEGLSVDDRTVLPPPGKSEARLPPGSRSFEIRYTALSLTAPEQVRFRYHLEGFDRGWVDAEGRRTAYYTNLGPGSYVFRVIASNNDGVWSPRGARLAFSVAPRFRETAWFPLSIAALTLLAGAGVYRLRLRSVRARERTLEALVEERTRDLEAATLRAEKARGEAEAANRTKSQLLANVSHEIRTPMNGVLGLADLLLRGELTPSQKERVEMVRASAEALVVLVNDLLDLSKLEAGRLLLRPVDFELRKLADEVVRLFEAQAREEETALSLRVDPALPDALHGDPMRLRQVLLNLVGNAVRCTRHGSVTVSIDAEDATPAIRFEVRDTGVGIRPEVQARLFQAFESEEPVTREPGGTGLGLFISKSIVEQMGGEIGFTSEPGTGSTFWFHLPMVPAHDAVAEAPRLPPSPAVADRRSARERFRILIADDHPVNRAVIVAQVQGLGYAADAVESGPAALAALEHGHYDVLLLDCAMPVVDGYETCRRLRESEGEGKGERLPVIAVTAFAMPEDREKCLKAGMDDYMTKPFRSADLAEVLDRWLGLAGGLAAAAVPSPGVEERIAALRRLETLAGKKIVEEVTASFRDRGAKNIETIRTALAQGAGSEVATEAHSLIGSAGLLGAVGLAGQARELELLAREGNLGACAERFPALEEAFADTVRQLARA